MSLSVFSLFSQKLLMVRVQSKACLGDITNVFLKTKLTAIKAQLTMQLQVLYLGILCFLGMLLFVFPARFKLAV